MVYLDEVLAASNNIPLGHSASGLALRLDTAANVTGPSAAPTALDPTTPSIMWEDPSAHGILTISTVDTPISVVWGNTSTDANAQPTHRWYCIKDSTGAWRVSDSDAVDYLRVSTRTSGGATPALTFGNTTTNPQMTFLGNGAWTDPSGSTGSSSQVWGWTASGPRWTTVSTGSSTGTSSATFDVNNGATGAASSTGIVRVWSGSGVGDLYKTSVSQSGSSVVVNTTDNGTDIGVSVILGLNSTSAASQSALTWSAASGGTQHTIAATWVASTQVLTFSGGVLSAPGAGTTSERFGSGTTAAGTSAVAVGYQAVAPGNNSIAIGATAATTALTTGASAVGRNAAASVDGATALGYNTLVTGSNGTALGATSSVTASNATAVGYGAQAGGSYGIAIGSGSSVSVASIVLGGNEGATAGRCMIGANVIPIDTLIVGKGNTSSTPADNTWRITDASGTNTAGANLTLRTGLGTGTASSGYLALVVGTSTGVSGSGANTATVILKADGGASGGRIAFFGGTPVAQQTVGAVTNSVTAGGTTGTIADYTIVDYATDSATIRNNIYQLARSVAQLTTAVRNLNLGA